MQYRITPNLNEEEVRTIAGNLLDILDNSLAGILIVDDGGHVQFANKALGVFLEKDHEQMHGSRFADFLPEKEAELFERIHQGLIKNPSSEFRTVTIHREENHHWFEIYYRRPMGPDVPTYFYFRNISIRAEFEDQLRERNAFLNSLIESSVDGIIASDMKGNIILFNPGAQEMLGYTEAEAIRTLHTTKLYVEGTAKEIMRKMRSNQYGGKGKCLKHRVIGLTKEGNVNPLSLSGGIIYDKDGSEIATFGIFTDLKQREEMERQLQQKQLELLQSEKMASVGKLAAGVAHEINNPLSGVLIYANLIREDLEEDNPILPDVQRIISETTRCKTIVRELLDFARQDEASCQPANINVLIDKGIHLIRNQALFHNVEIVLNLEEGLPLAQASAARLNQVILNLAINAAEAMDGKGTLTITTATIDDGKKIRVTVADTGMGIPPEIKSRIFDPFFTTKEIGKGTGLGLSISYRIVRDCGGTIDVESNGGNGASFIMEFQCASMGIEQPVTEMP